MSKVISFLILILIPLSFPRMSFSMNLIFLSLLILVLSLFLLFLCPFSLLILPNLLFSLIFLLPILFILLSPYLMILLSKFIMTLMRIFRSFLMYLILLMTIICPLNHLLTSHMLVSHMLPLEGLLDLLRLLHILQFTIVIRFHLQPFQSPPFQVPHTPFTLVFLTLTFPFIQVLLLCYFFNHKTFLLPPSSR